MCIDSKLCVFSFKVEYKISSVCFSWIKQKKNYDLSTCLPVPIIFGEYSHQLRNISCSRYIAATLFFLNNHGHSKTTPHPHTPPLHPISSLGVPRGAQNSHLTVSAPSSVDSSLLLWALVKEFLSDKSYPQSPHEHNLKDLCLVLCLQIKARLLRRLEGII